LKFEDISKLANLMKTSGLSEIEIEEDGVRLRISNGEVRPPGPNVSTGPDQPVPAYDYVIPAPMERVDNRAKREGAEGEDFSFIKSPMVGTFYSAPSPNATNYVEPDSKIDLGTVVCIIEAMKVMNEIQADAEGVIVDVLVKNGQTVEYGQPLFKVKKTE
jgi:acetyl-CoA carboxylase biotin carboxyl carrier protein